MCFVPAVLVLYTLYAYRYHWKVLTTIYNSICLHAVVKEQNPHCFPANYQAMYKHALVKPGNEIALPPELFKVTWNITVEPRYNEVGYNKILL